MNEPKVVRNSTETFAPNNSDKAKKKPLNSNVSQKGKPKSSREDAPKVKPIVKGKVVKHKKTFGEKFKDAFFGDTQSVGDYLINDVLLPAAKSTITELVAGSIDMLLYGERRGGRNMVRGEKGRSFYRYDNIYPDARGRDDRRELSRTDRARHNFDTLIFDGIGSAEDVLSHLVDETIEYGAVTVATFYELCGIESDYTDRDYGWTNLRDAYVSRARNGYVINFPPTRPL